MTNRILILIAVLLVAGLGAYVAIFHSWLGTTKAEVKADLPNPLAEAEWARILDKAEALKLDSPFFPYYHPDDDPTHGLSKLKADTQAFEVRYPQNTHFWEAKALVAKVDIIGFDKRFPSAPTLEEGMQEYAEVAEAQSAPKVIRGHASCFLISEALRDAVNATVDSDAKWDIADAKIVSFQKEFGNDFTLNGPFPVIVALRDRELGALYNTHQTARFDALVQKLTAASEMKVMRASVTAHLILVSEDEIATKSSVPTDEDWDGIEAKIQDFEKQFGDDSAKEIVPLRQHQLYALKVSGNAVRYQALLEKLLVDPRPEVVSIAKDFRNNSIREAEEKANSGQ